MLFGKKSDLLVKAGVDTEFLTENVSADETVWRRFFLRFVDSTQMERLQDALMMVMQRRHCFIRTH